MGKIICYNERCILREYENGLYCSDKDKMRCRDYKNIQLELF